MASLDQLQGQVGEVLARCHDVRIEALVKKKNFHDCRLLNTGVSEFNL
jgi:hypothetical protein